MKIFILIMNIFVLVACENAPVRREEMISKHPEWDSKTAEVIRQGYLLPGMTQEQVRAAWGRPCWSCVGTTKGAWGEAWEYPTQVVFFGPDGKMTRLQTK